MYLRVIGRWGGDVCILSYRPVLNENTILDATPYCACDAVQLQQRGGG